MNKTLFLLFALFAVTFVAAEEFGTEEAPVETLIEEESEESQEPVEMPEDKPINAKASITDRQNARHELMDAFINANLDTDFLEQQELLEEKQEGSGYGEMKEIMIKVDELEKKIRARLAKDLKYITEKRAYCAKTRAQHERNLRNIARAIKKNNSLIVYQQAKIEKNLAGRATSRGKVAKFEKTIDTITDQRELDIAGYKKRLKKRLKEIKVLHACNHLVCTEFSDFKNTKICKDILKNAASQEESKGQEVSKETLRDLLKQADMKEADIKKQMEKEQAEQKKNIAAGKAKETLKKNTTATTAVKPAAKKLAELVALLQNADLPKRTYAPARRVIMMIRTGEAAKVHAEPTKSLKEMTLPESLVHLLQRIVNDQKRETIDYMNQLKAYHKQIVETGDAIEAEVARQQDMANQITKSNSHIDRSRTDNGRRSVQRDVTTKALFKLNTDCRNEDEAYAKRREGRLGELVNIEKLRSLLRVLQNSDLPKCPSDCTNPDQGKCIWKGLYGKDSYCACKKGFHGAACEQRMCPGPNGVLYKADQRGVCSRRGKCDPKADKGTCTCFRGYYHGQHKSCEYKVCPGGGNCNGRGRCDKPTGKCVCFSKYYGHDCSNTKCPGANGVLFQANNRAVCSGNGACDIKTGKCGCSARFTGQYCQSFLCPSNCLGRGTCNTRTGKCECSGIYYGKKCEYRRCPENCGGSVNGRCDANSGRCNCHPGFSGPSCRRVSHGYNHHMRVASWYWRNNQWMNCSGNRLLTGVHRTWNHNDWLSSIQYWQCSAPMEGSKIMPLGGCYHHNWVRSFDSHGWSTCNQGFYVKGLYRSSCNAIYCIEYANCCSVAGANGYARCTNFNWWGCLDRAGWCTVSSSYFIRGFMRTSGHNLHNIEEASSCTPRRNANTRQL